MRGVLLFMAILAAACSSQVAGEETGPAADCEELAAVVCGKYFECFSAEERAAAGVPATEDSCVESTRADFACAGQTEVTACPQGGTYDPAAAAGCLAEHEALSCDAIRSDLEDSDTPSCAAVCR